MLAIAVLASAAMTGGARADEGRVVGARAVVVAQQPQQAGGAAPGAAAPSAVPAAAPAASVVDAPTTDARPVARAAASGGVTIGDFAFRPGTLTVHVGDTVSWANEDAAPHTATADDGSFDTGTLARGAGGSHAFASAGSFSYHCSIHPSMHGTVTVLASASAAPAPASSAPAAAPPTPTASAPTLPNTGVNALGLALLGFGLLLTGMVLRRLAVER